MSFRINGIQQIGIGIPDAVKAFDWYRKVFGTDIRVFDEAAVANLMLQYTGGEPQKRRAILAMNLESGGGFEIWQYTGRTPVNADFETELGDLGIYMAKIKSRNIDKAFAHCKTLGVQILSPICTDPKGEKHFYLKDPYGNIFQIVEGYGWLKNENKATGSVFGALIGVSDIEKALRLYSDVLGYDVVLYDKTEVFEDFAHLKGGDKKFRRIRLKHSLLRSGGFSPLLGPSELELVQAIDKPGRKIYENRFWGDLGFIHLCFDISNMASLAEKCRNANFPFTVDSSNTEVHKNTFDMGEAAGHFSYVEDPDGTLIEFVETHKVPILKKLGIFINMKKRNPEKSLPKWLIKAMAFNRVK